MKRSLLLGIFLDIALLVSSTAAQIPQQPKVQASDSTMATEAVQALPQIQQPSMIPFDANAPGRYRAVDLPPPGGLPTSNPSALTPPVPSIGIGASTNTLPSGNPPQRLQLPDGKQLLPRTSLSGNDSIVNLPSKPQDLSAFPPIPDLNALRPTTTSMDSGLNPPVPQETNRTTNAGSLVSFQTLPAGPTDPIASNFRASHLVAIVGTERVLAGDLAAMVEPIISENRVKISSKLQEEEVRQSLTRQALPQYIELKAMSQEFFRDMAGNVPPQELKKMQEQVSTRASRMFYERYVPLELFKRYKVEDLSALDNKLRETNLSVAILRNYFLTQALSAQLEEKYVAESYEIPPTEIMEYYQQNIQKWQIPARAKWRQLTVRFDRHGSEDEAQSRITEMGNEVVLGGKSFDAVARDSSHGFTSQNGGLHDWTFEGSLKSTQLDQAIFSLPLNRLSNIIRDDVGFHIIEVLQRESARTKDMAEIQTEIRKTLSKERRQKEAEKFRQKVLGRVVIWTLWPEDIPGSRPLSDALGHIEP